MELLLFTTASAVAMQLLFVVPADDRRSLAVKPGCYIVEGWVVDELLASHDKAKPLCLVVASHSPHVYWESNDGYDPETVDLPPYLVDTLRQMKLGLDLRQGPSRNPEEVHEFARRASGRAAPDVAHHRRRAGRQADRVVKRRPRARVRA